MYLTFSYRFVCPIIWKIVIRATNTVIDSVDREKKDGLARKSIDREPFKILPETIPIPTNETFAILGIENFLVRYTKIMSDEQ